MRLLFAMAMALLFVSCSSGGWENDSPPHREHRETLRDKAPPSQTPPSETWEALREYLAKKADPPDSPSLPETWEALREYLRKKADPPDSLPVVTSTLWRTLPRGSLSANIYDEPVLPFLWEDPIFWEEIETHRPGRGGRGFPPWFWRRLRRW